MKKIALSLLFCTLLACSNNDSSSSESSYTYKASVTQTCPNGTVKTYEITKATYESIDSQTTGNGPCVWISFKDIHNLNQKGYSAGLTRISN